MSAAAAVDESMVEMKPMALEAPDHGTYSFSAERNRVWSRATE